MQISSQMRVEPWVSALGLFVVVSACVYTWSDLSEARQSIARVENQLRSAQIESISSSEEQQRTLEFLVSVEASPEVDPLEPALWLSQMRASVAVADRESLRARVLLDRAQELSHRKEQRLLLVPVEVELALPDIPSAGQAISRLGESLGSYSSIDSCQLSRVRQLSENSGFRLRCQLLKVTLRVNAP